MIDRWPTGRASRPGPVAKWLISEEGFRNEISLARSLFGLVLIAILTGSARGAGPEDQGLPAVTPGWSIDLFARAPRILYPTAIVAAPDGTLYLGSDPMDMTGPVDQPIDRVLALKDGRITTFADGLFSVMGLEWLDDTLFVVHAPYLSAFRDRDGDGKADHRVDLITGLGPKAPASNGMNDHIASGMRLGMDGFLYIAVGDKGIPRGVGRDGKSIELAGGGVIRIRPDGSDLEVVSTGECNPLSVALTAADEIFTYGNDDDSKRWPNSLTHHIVGANFGYPYQFLTAPTRTLPIVAGNVGGVGTQGFCYNDDGLPAEYRGNLFFCDWGLQAVDRFEVKKAGGTFSLARRSRFVSKGGVDDFRPFSIIGSADGAGMWLVDWAFTGWRAPARQTGRLYRLRYLGPDRVTRTPRPTDGDLATHVRALDHPSLSARLASQRILARAKADAVPLLSARLGAADAEVGRVHAIWALDAIGGAPARGAIARALADASPRVRSQAARSAGIRGDQAAVARLVSLLNDRDPAVRREAAIALGKLAAKEATNALYRALGDADEFAAWSIRQAIRRTGAWDRSLLVEALEDDRRRESALRLTDEAWAVPVAEALIETLKRAQSPAIRQRIVANLAGIYRNYPPWTGAWFGPNPVAGPFPAKTMEWDPAGMSAVLVGLSTGLTDRDRMVRAQAIAGLAEAGRAEKALFLLRSSLLNEPDADNQVEIARALGKAGDVASAPALTALMADGQRTEVVRLTAVAALARFRDPQSLRARMTLVYDPKAPEKLVAQALYDLAAAGFLPSNDLAPFFEHASPLVRAAALLAIKAESAVLEDLAAAVIARLGDPALPVRRAAIRAVAVLKLRKAIPRLIVIARESQQPDGELAIQALCALPDPRASSIYQAALAKRDPELGRVAAAALASIGDPARPHAAGPGTSTSPDSLRRFATDNAGDPARGQALFFRDDGLGCGRCHSAGGKGTAAIGPDLTGIASKYDRAELIRSVLEPSSRIAPGYLPVTVSTRDGKVVAGVVRRETDEMVELAGSDATVRRIPKRFIDSRKTSEVSIMPEPPGARLSPRDFADLIGYLSTLKADADPMATIPTRSQP